MKVALTLPSVGGRACLDTTTLPCTPRPNDSRQRRVRNGNYGDVFLSVVESTGAGLVVLDTALRIRENNRAFIDQCGYSDGSRRQATRRER